MFGHSCSRCAFSRVACDELADLVAILAATGLASRSPRAPHCPPSGRERSSGRGSSNPRASGSRGVHRTCPRRRAPARARRVRVGRGHLGRARLGTAPRVIAAPASRPGCRSRMGVVGPGGPVSGPASERWTGSTRPTSTSWQPQNSPPWAPRPGRPIPRSSGPTCSSGAAEPATGQGRNPPSRSPCHRETPRPHRHRTARLRTDSRTTRGSQRGAPARRRQPNGTAGAANIPNRCPRRSPNRDPVEGSATAPTACRREHLTPSYSA